MSEIQIPRLDQQTVDTYGEIVTPMPYGVTFRDSITQIDERGMVVEAFDPRWQWHPDPFVFCYIFTIRPGYVKGWGLHKLHQDRYFILYGEMQVVLYDARPDSPTHGLVASVVLSEYRRRLMNIPEGVWHASRNLGEKDVTVVNFPTRPYDHANPDKYRLPIDTDQIPFKFENARGGG